MSRANVELSLEQQLMILNFWAHGVDISRKLSTEQIQAVPGLRQALDAAAGLPDSIGWGEEQDTSRTQGND
jgi:hypothetical protein